MISVVMPIYNHYKFVEDSIMSILSQTYEDFELILVDDGSTDGSSDIAKYYMFKDPRVRYRNKINGGTGSALNLGFSVAKVHLGTWVSSDNIYYSKMLDEFVRFFDEYKRCRFVFSGFSWDGTKTLISEERGILRNFLDIEKNNSCTGICFLFYMSLLKECGNYVLSPGEDWVMSYKMGTKTDVGFIPEVLGFWRGGEHTLSYRASRDNNLWRCKISGRTSREMVEEMSGINNKHVVMSLEL